MMKRIQTLCLFLALLSCFNSDASPRSARTSSDKKTLIAHFLNMLAQAALAISSKDKEQRLQATAQALTSLSLFAHLIIGKSSQQEDSDSHKSLGYITRKQAYHIMLEHRELLMLLDEKRVELCCALANLLEAATPEKEYNQWCPA
jgi:hypothetical protein